MLSSSTSKVIDVEYRIEASTTDDKKLSPYNPYTVYLIGYTWVGPVGGSRLRSGGVRA